MHTIHAHPHAFTCTHACTRAHTRTFCTKSLLGTRPIWNMLLWQLIPAVNDMLWTPMGGYKLSPSLIASIVSAHISIVVICWTCCELPYLIYQTMSFCTFAVLSSKKCIKKVSPNFGMQLQILKWSIVIMYAVLNTKKVSPYHVYSPKC